MSRLGAKHQGEVMHRVLLGYYDLLERITKRYPHIMIEGCASGGGRFDLGTLYYCPQIWSSDESDPAERMYNQFNTSLGYPLSCIGSHANNSKVSSYKTKCILSLFGTYGFEMNPLKLSQSEIEEINNITKIYRMYHKNVIEDGDLYHISSPERNNFMIMQAVSKDKSYSLVILMNKRKEHIKYRRIKLKGLNPESRYKLNLDESIRTGEELMKLGLDLSNYTSIEFNALLLVITEI